MSDETNEFNGKCLTARQLENDAITIEENLQLVNKTSIIKMLKVLNSVIKILKRKDDGIFRVLVKWFRLYLKLFNVIDPDDKTTLKFYENTVPTIITYLIGCLQYKPKKVPNYHHDLLEILEEVIESVDPRVLTKITKFEKETIGCLWTPIELAGDFNTQLKALKIFSVLLQQFDENRQKDELNAIKWTNLNFFQEKLRAVVQATKFSHVLENLSRELLNNFNMSLSKTLLVYSFHCATVTFAKQYKFHKPLNLQKFWIDINYCPKTVSFCGRFKLKSNSKYEIISVALKISEITLKNNTLQVYFNKPGEFSKYSEYFSSEMANICEFTLPDEEKQRLVDNEYVIEYFNNLNKSNKTKNTAIDSSTFDFLKTDMKRTLEENKTKRSTTIIENSKNDLGEKKKLTDISNLSDALKYESVEDSQEDSTKSVSTFKQKSIDELSKNEMEPRPKRSVRATNKFFKSYLMEESFDDLRDEVPKRKRKQKRKSRPAKPRCKQVCKVTPTVDLTKIEDLELLPHNGKNFDSKTDTISKENYALLSTQRCGEVLRQVADIYEVGDTAYAKPCQSYRNYQLHSSKPMQNTKIANENRTVKGCKKKIDSDNQPTIVVKRRKFNFTSQENKENVNPQIDDNDCPPSKTKGNIPHMPEAQGGAELSSTNRPKQHKNTESGSSSSSECEEVRNANENILKDINHLSTPDEIMMAAGSSSSNATTPRPTSTMNVSHLSDSEIEIMSINNFRNGQHQQTNVSPNSIALDIDLIELQNNTNANSKTTNTVNFEGNYDALQQKIVDDFTDNSDNEFDSKCLAPIEKTILDLMNNHLHDINYQKECTIFKSRQEEANNSSDEDVSNSNYQILSNETEPINNTIEKVLQKSLVLSRNFRQENNLSARPENNFQILSNLTTRTAAQCQLTPTALIMHKIQVSAEKSIILKRKEAKKESKANRCLNSIFTSTNMESMQIQRKMDALPGQYMSTRQEINFAPLCSSIAGKQNNPKDVEVSLEHSTLNDNCENNSTLYRSEFDLTPNGSAAGPLHNSFRNDFFQILNIYNTNLNQRADNILRQGIKNISDRYRLQFLDITKTVLSRAEENIMKLEEIRSAIGNLFRQLELQYEAFINKSKEFNIHSEMCKRILENLTTAQIPHFIIKEHEDVFKNLHNEQNVSYKNVCYNFLQKYEKKCV